MSEDEREGDAEPKPTRTDDVLDDLAESDDPDGDAIADVFDDLDTGETDGATDESEFNVEDPGRDGADEDSWSDECSRSDEDRRVTEDRGTGETENEPGTSRTNPFDELGDIDESIDDVFERMDVVELSGDDVWTALDTELPVGGEATTVDPEGTDNVVDKREYCQRCPHFSLPPETACTHPDGTIVEVIDTDEFRVRGCPMVAEEGPRFDRRR